MLNKQVVCGTIALAMSGALAWGIHITPSWRPDPSRHHHQHKATVPPSRSLPTLKWPLGWVNDEEVLSGELPSCFPSNEYHYWIVNVRTGKRRDLPTLRYPEIDKLPVSLPPYAGRVHGTGFRSDPEFTLLSLDYLGQTPFSADGNWQAITWYVHPTGIAWWLDKITPRPDHLEARLISLRDQSYWVFPWSYEDDKPDDAVLSVSLSPHGRRAIYNKDGCWYVTDLPTRENGQWQ